MSAYRSLVGVGLALSLSGCVVSTHRPAGGSPDVPLPPEELDTSPPAATRPGPVQIGASHFLVSYKGAMRAAPYIDRTKEEARLLAEELRGRALGGEDFAQIASQFSDDRGSAANGGSLGVFRRDQMVPEFSEAAFALEIGEVSEVVESPFGFHVILRTE